MHEQFGIWSHDLSIAKNESFADWIKNNPYEETEQSEEVVERRFYA
jgi:hypothetical protein